MPQPRDPGSTASKQQNPSSAKVALTERTASLTVLDNSAFIGSRQAARNCCPYKGLFAFWEEDAEIFFGRESLIQLLKEKLEQKHIIQVSGPSGSGKSSLVAAGLIPPLRRSHFWHMLYCRPGNDPFASLASALIPHLEPNHDEISRAPKLPNLP